MDPPISRLNKATAIPLEESPSFKDSGHVLQANVELADQLVQGLKYICNHSSTFLHFSGGALASVVLFGSLVSRPDFQKGPGGPALSELP